MPENVGTTQQRIVGGQTIDTAMEEEFGLLKMSGCSASLLTNSWAITAAHCIEATDAFGKFTPDPARPGQNMLNALSTMAVTAAWGGGQTRQVIQAQTFRPYDIAILQLDNPITVGESDSEYRRGVFQDNQFPYFGQRVPLALTMFGRGISQFAQSDGATMTPSVNDWNYRIGYAQTTREEGPLVWSTTFAGDYIAGGDSGGPSFAWVLGGYVLVGVHALAKTDCLPGAPVAPGASRSCGSWSGPPGSVPPPGYDKWRWVSATPEAADAPVQPVWAEIRKFIGTGAPAEDAEATPPAFIGTFAATPPDYEPAWVYAIQDDGILLWYRRDSASSGWQGPTPVGRGWAGFVDVIPAGGNRFYALKPDGTLQWYQHNGFNDGTFDWKGPVEVGHGWKFARIFAGGAGVVYAITGDGKLRWYRHNGYLDGGDVTTWAASREIGRGWGQFLHVFSTGQGLIYAVRPDGELMLYTHTGFENGDPSWVGPRVVGNGWAQFRRIVPLGGGVILAVKDNGELLWYRHSGGTSAPGNHNGAVVVDNWHELWEGPTSVGVGWQYFRDVIALLPTDPQDPH